MTLKNRIVKFIGVLAMTISSMTVSAQIISQDEAQIRSNLTGYAVLADQGAYEYLGRIFAPELIVDYTSLWGGEVQKVKREVLMKQWADFLPGFDTTYHDLSNLKVSVDDNKADASVDFTATHWLGDTGVWQLSGSYDFTLVKAGNNWQITSVKLNYSGDESGSRDVLSEAPKYAKENLKQREALKIVIE